MTKSGNVSLHPTATHKLLASHVRELADHIENQEIHGVSIAGLNDAGGLVLMVGMTHSADLMRLMGATTVLQNQLSNVCLMSLAGGNG